MPASAVSPGHRLVRGVAYALGCAGLVAMLIGQLAWFRQIGRLLKPLGEPALTMLLPPLLLVLAWAGALLVHEGGHWLGSWLVGFRCYAVVAGWLRLERRPAGWRLRLTRWPKGVGGYVHAVPREEARLRPRQAVFVAAGPVASLLAGALALAATRPYWDAAAASGHSLAQQLLLQAAVGFGGLSLVIGLGNLLPFRPRTDGSHLLALLEGGPAWQRQAALLRLSVAGQVRQQRPRRWPADELPPLLAYADQSATDCIAHYLAYAYALDQPRPEAATIRYHLQQALDRRHLVGKEVERALYAEAAYCAAMLTQQPDNARHWLKRVAEVAPLTDQDAFTQAVVAYSSQDYERAQTLLTQYAAQLARLPASDLRTQGEERLASVQAQLPPPAAGQSGGN